MSYASKTKVSIERSQEEIKKTLRRYGAGQYVCADDWEGGQAMIGFRYRGLAVRMTLRLPSLKEFARTPTGLDRSEGARDKEHRQGCRQRWRALVLSVKAKLEAVESGISTFEQEFLPYLVVQGGQTVAERVLPEIARAIQAGSVPKLIPMFEDREELRYRNSEGGP